MKEGIRIVKEDLKFIGITSEPEATAELYMRMFNMTKNIKYTPKFISRREGAGRDMNPDLEKAKHLKNETIQSDWWKDFDSELFKEVEKVFYSRCMLHGVSVTQKKLYKTKRP